MSFSRRHPTSGPHTQAVETRNARRGRTARRERARARKAAWDALPPEDQQQQAARNRSTYVWTHS